MQILIRENEACLPDPFLLWDSIFNQAVFVADWQLAGPSAPQNAGGLAAVAALETAVVLSLFTDKALPATHPLASLIADGDPRGWWGDGIDVRTDLGEAPLGSFLWILFRMPLTAATVRWAQQFAQDALAPLQAQGVVAQIDCAAQIIGTDTLALTVTMYGSNGQQTYNRKFDLIWQQVQAAA